MSSVDSLVDLGLLERDVPLGPLTTYKSGGPASLFTDLQTRGELDMLISSGIVSEYEILVLGRGSNLVVADSGFPGLVIRLGGEFTMIDIDGSQVIAGSAVPLPRLARATVEKGLTGLEFYVGIPGSVGGAVRQNAGCFGVETKDRLLSAEIVNVRTGESRSATPDALGHAYRKSSIAADELVTSARFVTLTDGSVEDSKAELLRITRWRKANQPGGTLNAGSVFKNPKHISAGELIDTLGLKGVSVGAVSVSKKHANFFVADPSATSSEILELMELVKSQVFELSGTMLEPEIQFVGFD